MTPEACPYHVKGYDNPKWCTCEKWVDDDEYAQLEDTTYDGQKYGSWMEEVEDKERQAGRVFPGDTPLCTFCWAEPATTTGTRGNALCADCNALLDLLP
jgi:hypothetical protein